MLGFIRSTGKTVTRWVSLVGALALFLVSTLATIPQLTGAGRRVLRRVFRNQVWFTAVQAIPLVVVLSAILSFLVISQAVQELGRIGVSNFIGTLMVVAIVRELGPLLTALAVAGRSGTAIAAELATNKSTGEIKALEGMGIDPMQYLVLPRLGGAVVSVFGLIILFDIVALGSGFLAAIGRGMSTDRYFDLILQSLTIRDTWFTAAKGIVFGAIIGIVPSYFGTVSPGASTDIPVAASRAVVASILGIFFLSVIFMLLTL